MNIKRTIARYNKINHEFGLKTLTKIINAEAFNKKDEAIDYTKFILAEEFADNIKKLDLDLRAWENITHQSQNKKIYWVFWWQGLDQMPDIVKVCYESQKEFAAKQSAELVLLTKDNYHKYVNIPPYIIQKVQKKAISLTHFSDILRVYLLEQYGGCWLDSTLFINTSVNAQSNNSEFWSFKISPDANQPVGTGTKITECKWAGFMMQCCFAHHPLFVYLKECLSDYWAQHDVLINYFIMNLLIRIAYDKIEYVTMLINSVDYNNPHLYDLAELINRPFDERIWSKITENTAFFKLTWKRIALEMSEDELTFYGVMKRKYISNSEIGDK